jgi:membrane-associated phospholipid phosphatase
MEQTAFPKVRTLATALAAALSFALLLGPASPAVAVEGPGAAASASGSAAAWTLTVVLLATDPTTAPALRSAFASPAADSAFPLLTQLGEGPGIALTLGGLWAAGEGDVAAEAAGAAAYAGLLVTAAKWAVGRGRPDSDAPNSVHYLAGRPGYDSFPSGHTATAFALARVLARRHPEKARLFYALAGLVGLSRVYLNRHYPGDVAAGALLGLYAADRAPSVPLFRFAF